MDVHVYLHSEPDPRIDRILALLEAAARKEASMAQELDALEAQVTGNTSVIQSAITLINGIADRIQAAGADPAKLAQLTSELKAQDDALAAAVAANTPAAQASA